MCRRVGVTISRASWVHASKGNERNTIQKSSVYGAALSPSSTKQLSSFLLFYIKGRQHPDFPGGHPPEYYPSLRMLNFAELTGYGTIILRWPSTSATLGRTYIYMSHRETQERPRGVYRYMIYHGYRIFHGYMTYHSYILPGCVWH